MGDREQRAVVVDGVVDALGVVVGLTRLHLPGEQGTVARDRCEVGEPQAQSLCGLMTGRVVGRDSVDGERPMCEICMKVAGNLILTTEQIGGRIRTRRTGHDVPIAGRSEALARVRSPSGPA
jgi:hypothetical protein